MRSSKLRTGFVLAGGAACALLWMLLAAAQPGQGRTAPVAQGTPLQLPLILKNFPAPPQPSPTPTPTTEPGGVVPEDGSWAGETQKGYVAAFEVLSGGSQWQNFKVGTDFDSSDCGVSGTVEVQVSGPGAIADGSFSYDSATYDFSAVFTSETAAQGNYAFENHPVVIGLPGPPWVCTVYLNESGTWMADRQP